MNLFVPVNQEILRSISRLDRFAGRWQEAPPIPPERLQRLREASLARSVAASCRMAGIRLDDAEVEAVLRDPRASRHDRAEILGVGCALNWPRLDTEPLLDADLLRRLHGVLVSGGNPEAEPSPWRTGPSAREAFSADGTATGRVFQTLPPRMVPEKIEDLVTWLEFELRSRDNHPLSVIGVFVLVLVAVSPFDGANGRLARVLAVRLLERAGYPHVRYASFDRIVEETRDAYYEAFDKAETRLWSGEADLTPWLTYFLDVLQEQRRRVEAAAALESRALRLSPLQQAILDTVYTHGSVDAGLLLEATGANRNTLKDNVRRLVRLGLLEKSGQRRGARYRLASPGLAGNASGDNPRDDPDPFVDLNVLPRRPVDH